MSMHSRFIAFSMSLTVREEPQGVGYTGERAHDNWNDGRVQNIEKQVSIMFMAFFQFTNRKKFYHYETVLFDREYDCK